MTTSKAPGKRWKPGQSGNPKGRPPGTGEVAKIRAAIAQHVPGLIEKLLEQAMAGDVGAARLLLERAIAPLKATEAPQAIQMDGDTLTNQGRAVLASVASGSLSAGQGAALIGAIGSLARVAEIDELERRIARLEDGNDN